MRSRSSLARLRPRLEVFTAPGPDDIGKFRGVVKALPEIWRGRVLDVGARSGHLAHVLCQYGYEVSYWSIDIQHPADVISDVGAGLPFADRGFETVVALDVLEHLDRIHAGFDELCRAAAHNVVISLPNCYSYKQRLSFVRGAMPGDKYRLRVEERTDRHRWLVSMADAMTFCRGRATLNGFEVRKEGVLVGPRTARFKHLVARAPDLLGATYLVFLARVR